MSHVHNHVSSAKFYTNSFLTIKSNIVVIGKNKTQFTQMIQTSNAWT